MIEKIIKAAAKGCGCMEFDIKGTNRHARAVLGRAVVSLLARRHTALSYPKIAEGLGRDSHSIVHTGEARMKDPKVLRSKPDFLEGKTVEELIASVEKAAGL